MSATPSYLRYGPTLLIAMLVSGCVQLHSPTREAQGKAAQKAWTDADTLEIIRSQRENSAALLGGAVSQVENSAMVARDRRLQVLAVGGSVQVDLVDPVVAQLLAVAGTDAQQQKLAEARSRQASFESQMSNALLEVERRGFERFSCADLKSGKAEEAVKAWLTTFRNDKPEPANIFEQALLTAKGLCVSQGNDAEAVKRFVQAEAEAALASTVPLPRLLDASSKLYVAEQELSVRRQKHASERNAYRGALLEFERALLPPGQASPPPTNAPAPGGAASAATSAAGASEPSDSGKAKTALEKAAENLRNAISKLKGLDDKYSLKFLSQRRIDAIDGLLGSVLEPKAIGDPTATDKDRIARALVTLSNTAEDFQAASASAQAVLLRPLLAQRAIDELQVTAVDRSIAADDAVLQILRTRVELLTTQARHYRNARDLLAQGLSTPTESLKAVMFGREPASEAVHRERTRIMQASGHYGYARGYLQGQFEGTTLKRTALDSAQTLAISENNVRQWNVLIDGNVDLLVDWSAAGVKEETISRAVNSLLLLWIGMGVN